MGHANISNFSRLFVNRLYAKGKLSIADAVAAAVKKGKAVGASEGELDDECMLSYAFGEIVAHLHSPDGAGYIGDWGARWPGPWIEPVLDFPGRPPAGVRETVTAMLRACAEVWVERPRELLASVTLFGACADAIQDMGHDAWAARVRAAPVARGVFMEWRMKNWSVFDRPGYNAVFDTIPWRFLTSWRKRFREIPLLADVSN